MHLKLTRDVLIGTTVRGKGDVIQAEGKYAEALVKSGAAVPIVPPVESAAPEQRPERATSPRQR